jgi:excisionase family DNA binding protein
MSETEQEVFATLAQAANLAGLSEVSIRRAVQRGELQFFRGRQYRLLVNRAELEQWIRNRETPKPIEIRNAKKK